MRGLRILVALGVLLAAAGVLLVLHGPLLRSAGEWLVVDDELGEADLIYVLNGGLETRSFHAAALYERGLAPRIVIPRPPSGPAARLGVLPNEGELMAEVIRRQGVPDSSVVLLPSLARNTWEEGAALARYARVHAPRRVIVVTSDYHTRRARWSVHRHLRDTDVEVRMSGAPALRYSSRDWWLTEEGLQDVVVEYLKTVYYRLRY